MFVFIPLPVSETKKQLNYYIIVENIGLLICAICTVVAIGSSLCLQVNNNIPIGIVLTKEVDKNSQVVNRAVLSVIVLS